VQALLVFLLVMTLSMVASDKRVLEVGRRVQLAQLVSSGLLFLLIGVFLGPRLLGLFPMEAVRGTRPLQSIALAVVGLLVGLNLMPQLLRKLPPKLYLGVGAQALLTFGVVALPLAVILTIAASGDWGKGIGAAVMLGACASLSSPHVSVLWYRAGRIGRMKQLSISLVAMLDDWVGLGVLAVALIFGAGVGLRLGAGLAAMAIVFGIACGALIAYLLAATREAAEVGAMVMGSVALVAGVSSYLHVSTLVSAVACGATVAIIGGRMSEDLFRWLLRFERPIFQGLMFMVGVQVDVRNPWVWVLLTAFVAVRLFGKHQGGRVAKVLTRGVLVLPPRLGYALVAQGGLSLCIAAEYLLLVDHPMTQIVFDVVALAAVVNEALAARLFNRAVNLPASTQVISQVSA